MVERTLSEPVFASPIVADRPFADDPPVRLLDLTGLGLALVRAGAATAAAEQLGVAHGASAPLGRVLVAGQRPDEWLLIGARAEVEAMAAAVDRAGHVTVVDQTHARALLRLTGPAAADVLAKLCDLDWGDAMTPDGAVVSGSVGGVTCDVIRHDAGSEPSYLLASDRSYGQFLFDALLDAGAEHGIGVVR